MVVTALDDFSSNAALRQEVAQLKQQNEAMNN